MRHKTLGLLAASTALIATSGAAQETYDLGTIVLSSSLSPVELGRTGTTIEVLKGDNVGENNSRVIDRLDRLPGVSSSSDGGLGQTSTIRIRGLSSKYIGVRINGIDVADPSGIAKSFNFGGLTGSGIERIEVLKGSQSALYGSEAIAGVIDIQTFRPTRLGFSSEMNIEGGSFGTYSGDFNLGYMNDTSEIAFTYGRITTDGISAKSDNTEKDGFRQTTATLTAEHQVNDVLSFGGSAYLRRGTVEFDGFATINDYNKFEERGARVYSELQTGVVKHTLSYSYFNVERKYPLATEGINYDGTNRKFAYLGSAELNQIYTLNFGIDHTKEKASTDGVTHSDHTTSVQAELLIRPTDTVDLSAALRYDDNSSFGGKTTGRLAAVWRPQDDLVFRAVIGTGFRTPSLYERFSDSGDPALKPEESRSYELGVEKSFGDVGSVTATLFYTEIDDLIDFDPAANACGGSSGCYNQVPGTTKSKGIELSGDYAITDTFTLYGNYTYTDAKTDGVRLVRTPRHDFVVGARNGFTDRLSGYVDVRHVADVVASEFAPANHKVGDYTLVGMGLSYDMTDRATAYLRIENLFDEDYETAGGYNQPGRAAYLGIRANF